MVVFGADPSDDSDWEDYVSNNLAYNKRISPLINTFVYHKNLKMSQRVDADDRKVLAAFFNRRLKAGVAPPTLYSLIEKFYGSPYSQGPTPALSFVSNKVQDALVGEVDVDVSDKYIKWLSDGMPDTDLFDDCSDVRKWLLLSSDESLLRYPDVVAAILKSRGPIRPLLDDLEALVAWNLGMVDERPSTGLLEREVLLPRELSTNRRSPMSIRRRSDTITQAVLKLHKREQ